MKEDKENKEDIYVDLSGTQIKRGTKKPKE